MKGSFGQEILEVLLGGGVRGVYTFVDSIILPTANNTGAYPLGVVPFAVNGTANAVPLRTPGRFVAINALAIAAETAIWTPAAGKSFRLMGYHLVSSVAGNIILRDALAGAIIAVIPSAANGAGQQVVLGNGIVSALVNNALTATGPALATLSGIVYGTEE